jgi:hypothetical protein
LEDDFTFDGDYANDKSDVLGRPWVAVFVCEFYRDYGDSPDDEEIFLREEKAWFCGESCNNDAKRDNDDFADNPILLWCSFLDFFGGKYVDITDSVVGDGVGVFDGSGGGDTGY